MNRYRATSLKYVNSILEYCPNDIVDFESHREAIQFIKSGDSRDKIAYVIGPDDFWSERRKRCINGQEKHTVYFKRPPVRYYVEAFTTCCGEDSCLEARNEEHEE